MASDPYPKTKQLARGERRYRRKVASPKQWAAIRAEKLGPCRVCGVTDPSPHGPTALGLHHLVSRGAQLGDDVADNLVALCGECHAAVTRRAPLELRELAGRLTEAELAYVTGKLGPDAIQRLFGAVRAGGGTDG